MAAKEGYCVKCKAKKEMKDPMSITMKNGRPATQGIVPGLRHEDLQDRQVASTRIRGALESPLTDREPDRDDGPAPALRPGRPRSRGAPTQNLNDVAR